MNGIIVPELKTELSIGTITANAAEILGTVKEGVKKYLDENYAPDEKTAKEDRAALNKAEKEAALKAARIRDAWNAPLDDFNRIIAGIRCALKEASEAAGSAAKNYEEKQRREKREKLECYFASKNFNLVSFEKIFNERWANKTFSLKDAEAEMDGIISDVYTGAKNLENIPEHGLTAKAVFLETLDMGETLRQIDALKANFEKLEREKAERAGREKQGVIDANTAEEKAEDKILAKSSAAKSLACEALAEDSAEDMYEAEFRLRETGERFALLRKFMTANGMAHEKLSWRKI